ncbi:zf-RVT domain-containing protein, partial [Cephalotus follicularis]
VLKLRECLARNLVYTIGDGRATSLWWDPWINGEALITKYGARVPIDADILMHAKVSAIIVNRQWAWPLNSWILREIDTLVRKKCIEQGPDVIQWLSKGKPFSFKAAWQVLRHILPKVAWDDIVWFPDCIPKHSFCLWLTFHDAHRTTDKLQSYGVVAANQCMFGCAGLKSIDHLFFGCKFTAEIWNNYLRKCGFRRVCRPWLQEAVWVMDRLRGRGFKRWILRIVLPVAVYFCWTERNNRVF